MNQLALQRKELAYSLTHNLREAERQVGMMLIKPIFGAGNPQPLDLIRPTSHPLPIIQRFFSLRTPEEVRQRSTLRHNVTRVQTASAQFQRAPAQQRSSRKSNSATLGEPQIQNLFWPQLRFTKSEIITLQDDTAVKCPLFVSFVNISLILS